MLGEGRGRGECFLLLRRSALSGMCVYVSIHIDVCILTYTTHAHRKTKGTLQNMPPNRQEREGGGGLHVSASSRGGSKPGGPGKSHQMQAVVRQAPAESLNSMLDDLGAFFQTQPRIGQPGPGGAVGGGGGGDAAICLS